VPRADPVLPDVPTMAEAGLPALTVDPSDWTGLLAPAGTPTEVIAKLNAAINGRAQVAGSACEPCQTGWGSKATTSAEFAEFRVQRPEALAPAS